MKKNICLFLLGLIVVSVGFAQINLKRSSLVVAGQEISLATDTGSAGYNIAATGPNQNWDYSALKAGSVDITIVGNKQWYMGNSHFPKANIGIKTKGMDSSITYALLDSSQLSILGDYILDTSGETINNYNYKLITFPSTYNTKFYDSTNFGNEQGFYVGFDPDSTGPLPIIDSIRFSVTMYISSSIVGYGTLKTPLGSYASLMQAKTNINVSTPYIYTLKKWIKMPKAIAKAIGLDGSRDTSYEHTWWTNDASVGFYLMDYSFAPGDKTATDIGWLNKKVYKSAVLAIKQNNVSIYPNPVQNILNVKWDKNAGGKICIMDIQGQKLIEILTTQTCSVDVSKLPKGIYFMNITDDKTGAILVTKKFVKE